MKIICGSCGAKYTVSDDKVQGKTVKVKCRKCGAVVVVSSTGEVQTTGGASAGAAVANQQTYTVSVSDTDQRSMTMADVVTAYNEGTIDAETYVWTEGMDDWQPLREVDAIVDALHEAAGGGDAAAAQPQEEEDGLSRTVAMVEGGMADVQAAIRAREAQGAYQPAAAAPAGPVPAAGPADFGMATVAMPEGVGAPGYLASPGAFSAAAPMPVATAPFSAPAAPAFMAANGSRPGIGGSGAGFAASAPMGAVAVGEENSAIFSLNMLTAKAGGQGASDLSSYEREDSGLIDLKALAAGLGGGNSGGIAAQAAAMPAADAGLFPLGAPPPAATLSPSSLAPPAAGRGTSKGLVLGLVGAVVVLAAALVFFVVKGTGPEPQVTGTTSSAPSTEPLGGPTAAPSESVAQAPTSEPSTNAGPSASTSATPPTTVAGVGVGRPPVRPPTSKTGTPSSPGTTGAKPPPPPPPPAAAGGCAADDLMCLMRKGAKKK